MAAKARRNTRKAAPRANTSDDRREGLDIDTGDLAKIDVQTMTQVAENCGAK